MLFNTQRYLKPIFKFMITVVISLCISTYAFGQTQPRLINFQGKLTDQQGQALDGAYTVIFSLYATATGGTALWSERHENLSITNGLVNALLGSIQSMDEPQVVEFDSPRYLGITIDVDNNANSADPEMLPRQRIAPAIHAYTADNAKSLAGDLGQYLVPSGGIIMWSGSFDSIPAGWALCDGTNGTPDLRDRFIAGAATQASLGATGGASSYNLSVSQLPSHSHSGSTSSNGSHGHSASVSPNPHKHGLGMHRHYGDVTYEGNLAFLWPEMADYYTYSSETNLSVSIGSGGSHSHSFTTGSTGSGAAIDNRPAYYALAFIMKL